MLAHHNPHIVASNMCKNFILLCKLMIETKYGEPLKTKIASNSLCVHVFIWRLHIRRDTTVDCIALAQHQKLPGQSSHGWKMSVDTPKSVSGSVYVLCTQGSRNLENFFRGEALNIYGRGPLGAQRFCKECTKM